jgi:hypothetical protein
MDDQEIWDALGRIRKAIAETFPSFIMPPVPDSVAAEAPELAATVRQLGEFTSYADLALAFQDAGKPRVSSGLSA